MGLRYKEVETNPLGYAAKLSYHLSRVRDLIFDRLASKIWKNIKVGGKVPKFQAGDKVVVYQPRKLPDHSKKLVTQWDGPYEIVRPSSHSDKAYYVKTESGEELDSPISILRMGRWRTRPKELEFEDVESLDSGNFKSVDLSDDKYLSDDDQLDASDEDYVPPTESKPVKESVKPYSRRIRMIPVKKLNHTTVKSKQVGGLVFATWDW